MNHLVMEDIKRKASVFVLHVPYGGGGPAVQSVVSDVTQITLLSYAALKGQIASGKVKLQSQLSPVPETNATPGGSEVKTAMCSDVASPGRHSSPLGMSAPFREVLA